MIGALPFADRLRRANRMGSCTVGGHVAFYRRTITAAALLIALLDLTSCGTVTGVPSHGGGKRFAVEQELIAASARSALQAINFSSIKGRSARVIFSAIGDEGGGNLIGGRMTLAGLISGNYSVSPTTRTTDPYGPVARQATAGLTGLAGLQNLSDGPTDYQSIGFINPRDTEFLSSLVATHLILAGVQLKADPKQPVDVLVIILVDVFGTIRDRTDYLVYNQERLRARTALEVAAVQQSDGTVIIPAQRGAAEATWAETYILWTGPTQTTRSLHPLDDLLMPPLPGPAPGTAPAPAEQVAPHRKLEEPSAEIVPNLPNTLTRPDTRPRTNPPFQ
jgi:hypothetical protein